MSVTTESPGVPATPAGPKEAGAEPRKVGGGLLDPKMLWRSTPDAFKKLDPRVQLRNPVMFVVEVGAVLCMYTAIRTPSVFNWTIVVWLRLTPVMGTTVPTGPLAGVKLWIVGVTRKFRLLFKLPPGIVTVTIPVVAPAGTVAVI